MENNYEEALDLHKKLAGKLEVKGKLHADTKEALALLYTPGVAAPCLKIADDKADSYVYTGRGNSVAVITDGSAVLGLGNIGPEAAMPVMEGKCLLFNDFAGINAVPLCIGTQDVEEIIKFVQLVGPSFGGINLEDISGPRCFEIERRLRESMDIPVFHDDQHGTAIVVLAGIINALKFVGKSKDTVKVVINGGGAAGLSIARLLMEYGIGDVIVCDINGAIYEGAEGLNPAQQEMAKKTNHRKEKGSLKEIIVGKDIFIGVSRGNLVSKEMVQSMATDAIVFAMANPTPEIYPADALAAGARVVGSGRSDFPNQVNNVLVFPGIFRGAVDCHAADISEGMKVAAAEAIAAVAEEDGLAADHILPDAFDSRVAVNVAAAVAGKAAEEGIAGNPLTIEQETILAKQFLNKTVRI